AQFYQQLLGLPRCHAALDKFIAQVIDTGPRLQIVHELVSAACAFSRRSVLQDFLSIGLAARSALHIALAPTNRKQGDEIQSEERPHSPEGVFLLPITVDAAVEKKKWPYPKQPRNGCPLLFFRDDRGAHD